MSSISCAIHKSGFYGKQARPPLSKENHKIPLFVLCRKPCRRQFKPGRIDSGQMRLKLNFLAVMQKKKCGGNLTLQSPPKMDNLPVLPLQSYDDS